jgi:hypothetical protein
MEGRRVIHLPAAKESEKSGAQTAAAKSGTGSGNK